MDINAPNISGSDSTSVSLISRVRRRDAQAWARMVQLYGPLIYHWCLRDGLSPNDAADVGQDVFLRLMKSIDQFQKTEAKHTFRGWLRILTRNLVIDFHRRSRRNVSLVQQDQDAEDLKAFAYEDSSEEEARQDAQWLFHRAVQLLQTDFEPKTIQAFWRVVVDDEPVEVVAADLGVSVNAVYVAKSRVLARLRTELADA